MRGFCIFLTTLLAATLAWAGEPFVALDRAQAKALVDPARHSAPTIVALWSAECTHCKANLQRFAALARQHRELRIVSVAVEPLEAARAEALERAGLPGKRYAYGDDNPDALAFALDPKWRGELPRTLFFDGRGGVLARSGAVDVAQAKGALGLR